MVLFTKVKTVARSDRVDVGVIGHERRILYLNKRFPNTIQSSSVSAYIFQWLISYTDRMQC